MHLMVDDEGESWQAGSPEFLKKLGDDHPDFDAVDYAVRNLGYIALRRHGESVRIICRAEFVTPISLVGLLYVLVDMCPRRVALTLFSDTSDSWQTEIVGSVEDATARIEALSLKSRGGLIKEPLDFSAIDRSRRLRFDTLLGAWRQCGGLIETLPTALLERADAADRSLTVQLIPDGRMAIVEYGPGFSLYGASWHDSALGRTLDDQPDRRYGAWLQEDYRRAIDSFTPQFDYVDATVAVTPHRKRRLVYERLVLPWRGSNGERLVSGFSVMRTTPSAS